jgi:prepilin-type processing-associated H-X9-DG protein
MGAMPDPIDYAHSKPKRKFWRFTGVEWLVIIGNIGLLISIMIPSISRMHEQCSHPVCPSNLRQIGQAMQIYAHDNGGMYPPDLNTLLLTQDLDPDVFICPSSTDSKAAGKTRAAKAADLSRPGHCSYIYVPAKSDPECVVAFDDPANHVGDGANVLFADGHVTFLDLAAVVDMLNGLNVGQNPPTLQTHFTMAEYRQDYEKNWKHRMPQLKSAPWHIPTTQPTTHPAGR